MRPGQKIILKNIENYRVHWLDVNFKTNGNLGPMIETVMIEV